ncbi:Low molecular weight protein-tyrosine-phosphatase YwlE [Stieleria maiorica]|uniref:L-threonylcarbamoyladenylate synthase n=1 Tax=Stieleria maiorica TaxID=2795974 RepID=A0A5B9MCS1_9BACT|nr:L-threonylcarbamoyladenylate synthase [Stieleria maiorica]QEF97285.1 Low molecular weight protein-tyrosine-phosphatase YwlE [Stieleria maiorica]
MTKVLDLRETDDPSDIIHRTVQALTEGQVVALPTDTVYGIAAHALNVQAVERIVEIKGRDEEPMAISVRSRQAAEDFFCEASPVARRLSHRCWPGPLTLVTPCQNDHSAVHQLPASVRSRITGPGGGIGFRVVDHRILEAIHRFMAAPLVLTSANLSGKPAETTAEGVLEQLSGTLPLLLDDGPTRYGGASTVARVIGNRWELLREGVIERAAMNQFVKPVIVMVCTGNTCRSPMAETLMRELLRKKMGREDAVRVLSAGVAASTGGSASPQSIEVMGERKLDLTGHASQPLNEDIMNVADLVLTMTRSHRATILAAWPDMHDRVFTLRHDGGDISDPIGMPVDAYRQCADQMEGELEKWFERLSDDFFPEVSDGDKEESV